MLGAKFRKLANEVFLKRFGEMVGSTGIDPNWITLASIPFAFFAAYHVMVQNWSYAVIFIFISVFIDNLDGAVAKAQRKDSRWGSYFDAMCDKYVEMVLYLGFALGGYPVAAFFAATGTMLISYAKPCLAIRIPLDNRDWPAIGERSDRLLLLILGTLLRMFYAYDMNYLLYAIAAITNIGALQRMLYARKLIQEYEKKKKRR